MVPLCCREDKTIMDKNTLVQFAKNIYEITLLFPKKEPLRHYLRQTADEAVAEFVMAGNDYEKTLCRLFELADIQLEIAAGQNWVSPERIASLRDCLEQMSREFIAQKETIPVSAEEKYADKSCLGEAPAAPQNDAPIAGPNFVLVPSESPASLIPNLPRDLAPAGEPATVGEKESENRESDQISLTAAQIARQNRIAEFLKEKGRAQVWEIQNIFPRVSKRTIRRDFRSMLEQGLIERTGERNTTAYKLKINLS